MLFNLMLLMILIQLETIVAKPILAIQLNGNCQIPSIFERQFNCIHFIVNSTRNTIPTEQECLLHAFYRSRISSIILESVDKVINRDVWMKSKKFNCETHVILVRSLVELKSMLSTQNDRRKFFAFSNILIVLDFKELLPNEFKFDQSILKFIAKYSLNVVWTLYDAFKIQDLQTKRIEFTRALSNDTFTIESFRGRQIFDNEYFIITLLRNEFKLMEIRASFFKCTPMIVYVKKGKQIKFDGVEYRCLDEITKNWNRKYTLRDFSKNITDPWEATRSDTLRNISDVGMCSVWLAIQRLEVHDLSRPYDRLCGTFLVPKPMILTEASYIYMPLSFEVWIIFLVTLLITAFLLKSFSYMGTKWSHLKIYEKNFNNFVIALIEVINIASSHGLKRFPIQLPIKVIIISWTFFSLLFGTGYTTGYTSKLTNPRYSKPIDTLSDFIEQDLSWGELGKRPGMLLELRESGNPELIELARRMREENNIPERLESLKGGKYGRFVKVLSKSYITDTETFTQFASSLRLMKQCILEYYTAFVFTKQSSFTNIFNYKISRIIEAGLHRKWFSDIIDIQDDSNMMHNFFDSRVDRATKLQAINMSNLVGAFYLLGSGIVLAFFVFLGEIVCKKIIDHRQNNVEIIHRFH